LRVHAKKAVDEWHQRRNGIRWPWISGNAKTRWQNPEITGDYVSFLPDLTGMKDNMNLGRKQGVVCGYVRPPRFPRVERVWGAEVY